MCFFGHFFDVCRMFTYSILIDAQNHMVWSMYVKLKIVGRVWLQTKTVKNVSKNKAVQNLKLSKNFTVPN